MTKISIIAAIAGKKRVLGKEGGMAWHIPGELKRFKEITMGHPIIMGRKTYQSIGRPLPGRTNIVITRDQDFQADGVLVVHSLDEALVRAKSEIATPSSRNDDFSPSPLMGEGRGEGDEIFIIGGAQIYEQALPLTDKLYLTVIKNEIDGDVFFPDYSMFTKVISEKAGDPGEFNYKFLELEK